MRIERKTRTLVLILVLMAGIGVAAAWIYYRYENAAVDPRVAEANHLLVAFDEVMEDRRYEEGFRLLDSIERIYLGIPCYAESYEMGVLSNNRGSAWLAMALYKSTDSSQKDEMLSLAGQSIRHSIRVYETWLDRFDSLPEPLVKAEVLTCYSPNDPVFRTIHFNRMIRKRVEELTLAQVETKRRLSVSYSNLGIIQRHRLCQDSAIDSYLKALHLWKRNPTAKNNLNTLLGRPSEDESIIQKLFPPDRKRPDN